MPANYRVSVLDQTTGERASSINAPVSEATLFTGSPPNDLDTLLTNLNGLSIGALGEAALIEKQVHDLGTTTRPTDPQAQNEKRYRVAYSDNVTGKKYSFHIPCADLTLLPVGSEFLDLTAGFALGLKQFLDANGESELSNPITVNSIQFVSR